MGIFDRLGSIINSYINDIETELPFHREYSRNGDSDYDAAYEELNDFLNGNKQRNDARFNAWYEDSGKNSDTRFNTENPTRQNSLPPEELRPDFECLGVSFGAGAEECKTAYKNLLKIHHPDRHTRHEGNFKKATERSMRINAAWDRIEKWRKG
jgi:DnaJ-class molecular chaperone